MLIDTTPADVQVIKSDWDVVCETGRLAAAQLDEGRWILGDLALLVDKAYGEDKVGDFARECNVPKKRIYEYRQVCSFWQNSARTDLWEIPTVTYSLMRLAMRLETLEAARAFVERCAARCFTVDKSGVVMGKLLGLSGKRQRRPKPLLDLECRAGLLCDLPGFEALRGVGAATVVRVVVYATAGHEAVT